MVPYPEVFVVVNMVLGMFWAGCMVYALIILVWDIFVMKHRGIQVVGWDIIILVISSFMAILHHNLSLVC